MKGNTTAETRHDMVKAEEERELIGTNLYLFFIFYFILFFFFFFFFFCYSHLVTSLFQFSQASSPPRVQLLISTNQPYIHCSETLPFNKSLSRAHSHQRYEDLHPSACHSCSDHEQDQPQLGACQGTLVNISPLMLL